jgi:hypothetical protein
MQASAVRIDSFASNALFINPEACSSRASRKATGRLTEADGRLSRGEQC